MTLLELILACAILIVLASAAVPIARVTIKHQRERELRIVLREMRAAIDKYKEAADRNLIQIKLGSEGYPPDLETLTKGVSLGGAVEKTVRFLRRIPVDPMTGRAEWGLRSVQDEPDSRSWGGQNVFDVYSLSTATGSDRTRYSTW